MNVPEIAVLFACVLMLSLSLGACKKGADQTTDPPPIATPSNAKSSKPQDVIFEITDREYAVYSALLNRVGPSPSDNGKPASLVVINAETVEPPTDELPRVAACDEDYLAGTVPPRRDSPTLLSDELTPAIDDLFVKNKKTYALDRRFHLSRDYVLLPHKEWSGFFEARGIQGWDSFYEHFHHSEGFKILSRVGFDATMTKALVYVTSAYTTIDTFPSLVLLTEGKTGWKILHEYTCNTRASN